MARIALLLVPRDGPKSAPSRWVNLGRKDSKLGPGVEMINPMPIDRTGDPGLGLEKAGHKVLTYRDLVALQPSPDTRAPTREVEVHLTGNMDRYMWSMDGKTMQEAHEPLPMRSGERVRVTLINDTMMAHPIHLHGHIFELVTGHGDHSPRKHTVNVLPGGKVSFSTLVAANRPDDNRPNVAEFSCDPFATASVLHFDVSVHTPRQSSGGGSPANCRQRSM